MDEEHQPKLCWCSRLFPKVIFPAIDRLGVAETNEDRHCNPQNGDRFGTQQPLFGNIELQNHDRLKAVAIRSRRIASAAEAKSAGNRAGWWQPGCRNRRSHKGCALQASAWMVCEERITVPCSDPLDQRRERLTSTPPLQIFLRCGGWWDISLPGVDPSQALAPDDCATFGIITRHA